MTTVLRWKSSDVPSELHNMLKTLGESYRIVQNGTKGVKLILKKTKEHGVCKIERDGNTAVATYSAPAQAGRALGALLSGMPASSQKYSESTPFEMLGIMLDCSRNAVMTVDHVKRWLRQLCLLGYNMAMLYTEDTYELEKEPWFGYQRGAYTKKELKTIDDYAAKLDMEVIPCIQTLGHLGCILKHQAYAKVKDTPSVMMVGETATYELIEKMIKHWKTVCRTNRIHVGMDETHDLGRGRYLDLKGYKHGFDLFNEHLAKVVQLCKKHGLKPMIWSDMYFRLGCKSGGYYDPATVIPERVVKKIPKQAELVYWDYYHDNKEFYLDWIERHRKMGKEPLVGSGIWTWNRYWHDNRFTEKFAGPCIEACREAKVKELFFTQWGDNGAYCDHDSAFAGMTYCADKAYGAEKPDAKLLEKRFNAVCGGSYAAHILAGDIHAEVHGLHPNMWDDPFFETYFRTCSQDRPATMAKYARGFSKLASSLAKHKNDRATGDLLHAYRTAKAFASRYSLSADLLAAYRKKDKKALKAVIAKIPSVVSDIKAMEESFRTMWLNHNKPEGLEIIQARFGMLEARYREMTRRLKEYIGGKIKAIPELDCKCPPK